MRRPLPGRPEDEQVAFLRDYQQVLGALRQALHERHPGAKAAPPSSVPVLGELEQKLTAVDKLIKDGEMRKKLLAPGGQADERSPDALPQRRLFLPAAPGHRRFR